MLYKKKYFLTILLIQTTRCVLEPEAVVKSGPQSEQHHKYPLNGLSNWSAAAITSQSRQQPPRKDSLYGHFKHEITENT